VAYSGAVDGAKRQSSSNPKYLYHYTDQGSLDSIAQSGQLKSSTLSGNCALGRGVYFTGNNPHEHSSIFQFTRIPGGQCFAIFDLILQMQAKRQNAPLQIYWQTTTAAVT